MSNTRNDQTESMIRSVVFYSDYCDLTCILIVFNLSFEQQCVVPKNIHPPTPTEGNGNSEGEGGGSKRRQFPSGRGVAYRGFFPGGLSKIGELLINTSFSAEQAFSYFTVTSPPNKYCCLH